jgi:DNA-binding NtrC family response regulator
MDGFEVLKEMKKINPDVKAIMITGSEEKESQTKARKMGAIDYIIKPLDLEDLHQKIQTYILQQ